MRCPKTTRRRGNKWQRRSPSWRPTLARNMRRSSHSSNLTTRWLLIFSCLLLTSDFLTITTAYKYWTGNWNSVWPGGSGYKWSGGPESWGWRTGGGDTAACDQGPKEKGEKVQHWNLEPAKEVTMDISYFWKVCVNKGTFLIWFYCPGQESGPGEGEREPDCRGWGAEPAGRQAPGGPCLGPETGPEAAPDQGDLLWRPLHVPGGRRSAGSAVKGGCVSVCRFPPLLFWMFVLPPVTVEDLPHFLCLTAAWFNRERQGAAFPDSRAHEKPRWWLPALPHKPQLWWHVHNRYFTRLVVSCQRCWGKKKLVTSLHISDGFVLLLISRRVWEILQRRWAHGSVGGPAGGRMFEDARGRRSLSVWPSKSFFSLSS